jgi:phage/plasmid-like protein (TIGR03299 family)
MAHNLAVIDGKLAMFCVGNREAAWHKLGQRTDSAATWQEAMGLAGLDWTVEKIQLSGPQGPVEAWGIFRTSDGQFLGPVGDAYTPIQNRQAFDFVDCLLEAEEGAHYESAGALGNGERVWCLARIPHDFTVASPDDKHQTYLMFATSHDGSLAATCKLTAVRVVCQNTLNMALGSAGKFIRVLHTRNATRRLEEARDLMQDVAQSVESLQEKLGTLAQRRMTGDSMTAVLEELYPKPKATDQKNAASLAAVVASTTRRQNILDEILKLYELNDGNAIPEIRGTAYNLLNAVTEYTDHVRRVDADQKAQAESVLFGTGERRKSEALEVILQATSGNPVYAPLYSRPVASSILDDVVSQASRN